jgi:hypothetical protein
MRLRAGACWVASLSLWLTIGACGDDDDAPSMCKVEADAALSEFDAYTLATLPKGACGNEPACTLHVHDLCPGTNYPGPDQRWRCACERGRWRCEVTETSLAACLDPDAGPASDAGARDSGASDSGASLALCAQYGPPQNAVMIHDTVAGLLGDSAVTSVIMGVVTSLGDGIPPEIDAGQYGWQFPQVRWIKIEDGTRVWTIASRELPPFGMKRGARAHASYFSTREQDSGPRRSMFELRSGDSGQLAFWYGTAGKADELSLPDDVKVTRRGATCMGTSECNAWHEYALEMSVQGGKPITLATGESMLQGDYLFKNIRSAYEYGTSPCDDAYVADTTIVIAHASPFTAPDPDAGSENDAGQ